MLKNYSCDVEVCIAHHLSQDGDEVPVFSVHTAGSVPAQSGSYDSQMVQRRHPQTVLIATITE